MNRNKHSLLIRIVTLLLLSIFPTTLFAGEVLYYHTDNFGTPMAMTDKNGKVVWRADELPFGEEYETQETPERNNRRFLGKQLDKETGLVSMGARYLDPKTGRFTQPDPVGLVDPATGKFNQEMLLNPQRLNRYVYALNNPYKYADPDGENAIAILGASTVLAVGATIYIHQHPEIVSKIWQVWNENKKETDQKSIPKGSLGTAKDAQKKVRKGQGPRDVGSIHKPEESVPGSQWHAHGKGKKKGAINADGTIHDAHKGVPDFSKKTNKWLQDHGWKIKRR